jgi:DNA polymerase I-like protein with 3'-5' exonuclease and polymerase domains
MDFARPGGNYWPTLEEEQKAWEQVAYLLESPIPKLGQNFIYDLQYIVKMGIRPRAFQEDTMLLHHSLYPEMQKDLGFLGSIYTNEAAWKLMRTARADTEKREE